MSFKFEWETEWAKKAAKEVQEYEDNEILRILENFKCCEICGTPTKSGETVYPHSQEDCNNELAKSVVDS